jgi:hypothetical protein
MPTTDPEQYARVMLGAREDVYVVATRRSLNIKSIAVHFDSGRGPGPHAEHVLTISLHENEQVSVETSGIPHEWIATLGTGYIDARFVKCVAVLLAKLEKKAAEAGIDI